MAESRESMLESAYRKNHAKALEEQAKGDLNKARYYFFQAAQNLNELADLSVGDVRKKRKDEVRELINVIKSLERQMVAKNLSTNKSQTNNKGSQVKKEDTETIWETDEHPDITFDDIAGLDEVKNALRKKVIYPKAFPEYYEKFKIKLNGGILMYGLPGTGKTMMAKAIAAEIDDCAFFAINCSDIKSKYVGESERNVRNLFETARKYKYAVIFFDEFEAIARKRSESDEHHSNGIVAELLAQMQGFNENNNNLLFIAATNRPWQIDSALMRPGRFSERIYVPLPDDEARKFLINKSWKDVPLANDVNIDELVCRTKGYNSADVIYLCESCKIFPVERAIDNGNIDSECITKSDIEKTLMRIKSSVQGEDVINLNKFIENN